MCAGAVQETFLFLTSSPGKQDLQQQARWINKSADIIDGIFTRLVGMILLFYLGKSLQCLERGNPLNKITITHWKMIG